MNDKCSPESLFNLSSLHGSMPTRAHSPIQLRYFIVSITVLLLVHSGVWRSWYFWQKKKTNYLLWFFGFLLTSPTILLLFAHKVIYKLPPQFYFVNYYCPLLYIPFFFSIFFSLINVLRTYNKSLLFILIIAFFFFFWQEITLKKRTYLPYKQFDQVSDVHNRRN